MKKDDILDFLDKKFASVDSNKKKKKLKRKKDKEPKQPVKDSRKPSKSKEKILAAVKSSDAPLIDAIMEESKKPDAGITTETMYKELVPT